MKKYFDIYTGDDLITEYNKGWQVGDMLVSKIGDGESSINKNSRNHCEFIYDASDVVGGQVRVFGWGNIKISNMSRANFSLRKNVNKGSTKDDLIYNGNDGTYYSVLYRRKVDK